MDSDRQVIMAMTLKNRGFTLIELSIVLVILGLLVGGATVGTSLIHSGKLQRIISEVNNYTQAVQMFKEKYHALPGDMADAESFWGTDPAGCPGTYTATAHITTCNGNGDGYIGGADGASNYSEWFRAWQQLFAAGFTSFAANGISGTGSTHDALIDINVPAVSKWEGAGYTLAYQPPSNGSATVWAGKYGHKFNFGNKVTNADTYGPALTPNDAAFLDKKIDDGLPAFGTVMAAPSATYANCTTSDTPSSSTYDSTQTIKKCGLIFLTGF